MVSEVMNFIEKRIFSRLDAEVGVEVETTGQTLRGQTRNISCGGLFLQVDTKKISDQDELKMVIHLPNSQKPIKMVGEIRRSESDGLAVKFAGLYNDNVLALEKFIKSNLH